jgi:hypothetical protein
MSDLQSVVAFFHKPKWTGLDIRQEINRVPGAKTISYSTVGKCVREFVLSTKETDAPNILFPLRTYGFIERSIANSIGLQRMISWEQGREEGLITTKQC